MPTRHLLGLLALASVSVLGSMPASAVLVIDSFETPIAQITATGPGANASQSFVSGPGIIGSERRTIVTTGNAAPATSFSSAVVASGELVHSWNDPVPGSSTHADLDIFWDGPGTSGLGPVDLTEGGQNTSLVINFAQLDAIEFISLEVATSSGQSRLLLSPGTIPPGPTELFYPFADFSLVGGTDVDFSSVHGVFLRARPDSASASGTLTIDSIEAIPEPSTALLLGGGLLALGAGRWRSSV